MTDNRRHAMIRAARKGSMYARLDRHASKPVPFSAINYQWLSDLFTGDSAVDADIKLVYRSAYETAHSRARAQMAD